jgi:hypothetical protein
MPFKTFCIELLPLGAGFVYSQMQIFSLFKCLETASIKTN